VNLPKAQIGTESVNAEVAARELHHQEPEGRQHHVCFEVDESTRPVDEMGKAGATVLRQPVSARTVR